MNFEIRQKFNNFVKVIENKEKEEWLKQNNNHSRYIPDVLVSNPDIIASTNIMMGQNKIIKESDEHSECVCELSQGYSSFEKSHKSNDDKNLDKPDNILPDNILPDNDSINSQESYKINYTSNKAQLSNKKTSEDNLSLLEDDYVFEHNKIKQELNIKKSVESGLKNKFKIDLLKKNKEKNYLDNSDMGKKLEKTYDKILYKNETENNNLLKINPYDLENYLKNNKYSNQDNLSKLNEFVEFIFNESTRGWNYDNSTYIFNFDKFKDNLKKIVVKSEYSNFKIGIIYRDYTNPKVHLEKDFSVGWIGYSLGLEKNKLEIKKTDYSLKNKVLYYCFKNLIKSNKFKKKIGSSNYKFIKKTVQVYGNKDLIIDIILYVVL